MDIKVQHPTQGLTKSSKYVGRIKEESHFDLSTLLQCEGVNQTSVRHMLRENCNGLHLELAIKNTSLLEMGMSSKIYIQYSLGTVLPLTL